MTDVIALTLSFFFLIQGASRGFMNSLMTPFSVTVSSIISYYFYQNSKNMTIALIIVIIGPLILNLILRFLLKKWAQATNRDIAPGPLSRLTGALITLAWGWTFIIFTLMLISFLPPWGGIMKSVRNDTNQSFTYWLVVKPLEKSLLTDFKTSSPLAPAANPKINAASTAMSLADDPRFQKILQDPQIKHDADAHDIVKLMNNPKMMEFVQEIMRDPDAMQKVMNLYSSQTAEKNKQGSILQNLSS